MHPNQLLIMNNLKFNAIFESTYHAIAFLKLNGLVEDTNALFKRTFLLTEGINTPLYLWDLFQPEERVAAKEIIEFTINNAIINGSSECTISYTDYTASTRMFSCTFRSYEDEHLNKAGIVFKAADVTASIQLKLKLEEAEERYNLSLLGSGDGLWDWKVQEDLAFFSPRFRELMGYPAEEYTGGMQSLLQVLHPDDVDATTEALQDHLLHKKPFNHEYRLNTISNGYRWFLVRGQAMWNEEGVPVRMAGSLTDIHLQKQLEEDLKKNYQFQNKVMQVIPDVVLLLNHDLQIKNIFSSKGQLESIGLKLTNRADFAEALPKKYSDLLRLSLQKPNRNASHPLAGLPLV